MGLNSILLSLIPLALSVPTSNLQPRVGGGVNLAGFDFGIDGAGNKFGSYATPPDWHIDHFADQGVRLFRIPFGWSFIQPSVGSEIDNGFFSNYDRYVQKALSRGARVIIDFHNYGWRDNKIIGQGGVTNQQFSDAWTKIASRYAKNDKIIFGLMNEPHDMDLNGWAKTAQAGVQGIRKAGATSQLILIPGLNWACAEFFPDAYPAL